MLLLLLLLLLATLLLTENLQLVSGGPLSAVSVGGLLRAPDHMERNPETLEELTSEDEAVLEGDLLLETDRNSMERAWPTRRIPYVVSPELAQRTDHIREAMAMVSEQTCVSFGLRRDEDDFLRFQSGQGCASYVGCIGGEQPVFIGPPCMVGNIAHELLHALGFHHEHTRADREQHITVLAHNILHGKERNFHKVTGKTFGLPYDMNSIMHYGGWYFSSNGRPTIVAIGGDPGVMGQRDRLTARDVRRVRLLYACDAAEETPQNRSGDGEGQLQDSQYAGHGYPTATAHHGGDRGRNSSSFGNASDRSQNPQRRRSGATGEEAGHAQQDQPFQAFLERLRSLIGRGSPAPGPAPGPAATRGCPHNSLSNKGKF